MLPEVSKAIIMSMPCEIIFSFLIPYCGFVREKDITNIPNKIRIVEI